MANPNNFASFTGKLGADPKLFHNSDGSIKVKLSLYAQNNYKSADGKTGSVRGSFEAFISKDRAANGIGVYSRIHKGDTISVMYELRNNDYVKNGVQVYEEVKQITSLTMLEARQITEARQANRRMQEQAATEAAQAAMMAAQEQEAEMAAEMAS